MRPAPVALQQSEAPPPPPPEEQQPKPVEPALDRESLVEKVASLSKLLRGVSGRLDFDVHEASSQLFVRVVDRRTNQVVRTMPPLEFLELKDRIHASIGLLLDEQA